MTVHSDLVSVPLGLTSSWFLQMLSSGQRLGDLDRLPISCVKDKGILTILCAVAHRAMSWRWGRKSQYSLYDEKIASFEDDGGLYDQKDAPGAIKPASCRHCGRQQRAVSPHEA